MLPKVLLPATTALGTIAPNGRELGILSGAARPRVEVDAHARGKKTGAFAALGRMRGGLRHQRAEATGKDIP